MGACVKLWNSQVSPSWDAQTAFGIAVHGQADLQHNVGLTGGSLAGTTCCIKAPMIPDTCAQNSRPWSAAHVSESHIRSSITDRADCGAFTSVMVGLVYKAYPKDCPA